MGETTCKNCGHMNWHIRAHATGRCENCGQSIDWCDSCMVRIPKGGDGFGKGMLEVLTKSKEKTYTTKEVKKRLKEVREDE